MKQQQQQLMSLAALRRPSRSLLAVLVTFALALALVPAAVEGQRGRNIRSYFGGAIASNHGYGSGSEERMSRVHKSIGDIGCKVAPSLKIYKTLNKVCEDCFQLYRDAELYTMCRYRV